VFSVAHSVFLTDIGPAAGGDDPWRQRFL